MFYGGSVAQTLTINLFMSVVLNPLPLKLSELPLFHPKADRIQEFSLLDVPSCVLTPWGHWASWTIRHHALWAPVKCHLP